MFNKRKKKILFVAEDVTMAHFIRPLVLASALDKEKFEVYLASASRYSKFNNDPNINMINISTISQDMFFRRAKYLIPLYTKKDLMKYHREELILIKKINPDIIVGDLRFSLASTAQKMGIPFVAIVDDHLNPYIKQKYVVPNNPLVRIFGRKIVSRAMPFLGWIFEKWNLYHFNGYRNNLGLPACTSIRDFYTIGDCICFPHAEIFEEKKGTKNNFYYTGPILWEPKVNENFFDFLNDIPKYKKVVYISMGSSGDLNILNKIINVVEKMPIISIIGSSGRIKAEKRGNVFIFDFVPALRVLERASLVIGNGGSPIMYQAFSKGVPILGIPNNIDQCFTMQGIAEKGASEIINIEDVTEKRLRIMIEKMLQENAYTKSAKKLKEIVLEKNCAREFARIIMSI